MNTHADKTLKYKSPSVANKVSQKQSSGESTLHSRLAHQQAHDNRFDMQSNDHGLQLETTI